MNDNNTPPQNRLWLAAVLALIMAVVLIWRWSDLQVERFKHFSKLAHNNQIVMLPVEPPRGKIFDRNGVLLADNETAYRLEVASDSANIVMGKMDILTSAIKIPEKALDKLKKAVKSRVYKGLIPLRENMNEDEIAAFLRWQFLFPEVVLRTELVRHYPQADTAAHAIGHVGRLTAKDVEKIKKNGMSKFYHGAKFIGKTGVESLQEKRLRGILGLQESQVDAHGRTLGNRAHTSPQNGDKLTLSIDMRLQKLAETLLSGERGAVVVLDVNSGAVLALASSPRFDINAFVFGISTPQWKKLNESADKPLIHRAIYGQYSPGSTIKPFLAMAALENGWRKPSYTYFSRGFFDLTPKHRFHDWKKGGHGTVSISKSIIRSVNSFYYQLGDDIGIDEMKRGLSVFGFGKITGIDLDNEKPGTLPSSQWKKKTIGEAWYPGDTIAASVGQGYLRATPLQMARAMAIIANGGYPITPYIVESDTPRELPPNAGFNPEYLQLVQDALTKVTQPGGTASQTGKGAVYGIAGKTGTAQVARLQLDAKGNRIKNKDLPKNIRDHAWFIGYAPTIVKPQLSIAVLVENGGSGGKTAAPIARQIFDFYFADSFPNPEVEPEESSNTQQDV